MLRPLRRSSIARGAAALAVLVALAAERVSGAQPTPDHLAVLFMRVLAYDRALKARAGAELAVMIVYRQGDASSEAMRNGVAAKLDEIRKKGRLFGVPMRVVSFAYTDASSLEARLGSERAAAVYLCPGLRDHLAQISAATRRRSVLSVAASADYLKGGVSVALVPGSGKSMVQVNLPAAKAEGADLDARFLAIAEVIQ